MPSVEPAKTYYFRLEVGSLRFFGSVEGPELPKGITEKVVSTGQEADRHTISMLKWLLARLEAKS